MAHFGPQGPKSDPKRYPKGSQNPPRRLRLELSKHIVITVQNTHWATLGGVWVTTFFWFAFRIHIFHTFGWTLADLGPKRVPNEVTNPGASGSVCRPISRKWPKWAPGLPKDPKMEPKGAKMEPQGLPNGRF